jgi:hypothetical protein
MNQRELDDWNDDDVYGLLGGSSLELDYDSIPWILKHLDCFFVQARYNESVDEVHYYGYSGDYQGNEVWDKLGQAIGNLHVLKKLYISIEYDEDEDVNTCDWEILARVLSHVRQKIGVNINDMLVWDVEQSRLFARAIHGHPTITRFEDGDYLPYASLDTLYSALATLPALESISLCGWNELTSPEDESALAHPESLTKLLRVSTLRSVSFNYFVFTPAICQAIANAFMEGTAITDLEFQECSFFAEGSSALMAHGLSTNTSVSHVQVMNYNNADHDLSPLFLALRKNTGLKTLQLDMHGLMNESLCTAMNDGLGINTALENLELGHVHLTSDNYDLWCNALSFLLSNKSLTGLVVDLETDVIESRVAAFRCDAVAMLQENASLGHLSILSFYALKAEEYIALITTLQQNTTLKTLRLHYGNFCHLTEDEDKQMAVVLQKNYALVTLPDINLVKEAGNVGAILRLNEAGRRYLVEDGSSVSKGVEVLSAVSNEINCVFLHLLENPRLCDRSAVEKESPAGSSGSASPANYNGKREQDQTLKEAKESRRRRT